MFDLAFNDLNDILAMNGHGVYVWSVYSIAISIIVASPETNLSSVAVK